MFTSAMRQVNAAIQKLKAFHRLGQDSLRQRPAPAPFGDRAIGREAGERGLNQDALYKARVFASGDGYTRQELAELCALCREYRRPFGLRMVFRLLSIRPKAQRAKVQREAIVAGWSAARMDAEIRKRFGRRRQGGKAPDLPETIADALDQVEHRARRWLRWTELLGQPGDGPSGQGIRAELPAAVRQRLDQADAVMLALHKAVQAAGHGGAATRTAGAQTQARPRQQTAHHRPRPRPS